MEFVINIRRFVPKLSDIDPHHEYNWDLDMMNRLEAKWSAAVVKNVNDVVPYEETLTRYRDGYLVVGGDIAERVREIVEDPGSGVFRGINIDIPSLYTGRFIGGSFYY